MAAGAPLRSWRRSSASAPRLLSLTHVTDDLGPQAALRAATDSDQRVAESPSFLENSATPSDAHRDFLGRPGAEQVATSVSQRQPGHDATGL